MARLARPGAKRSAFPDVIKTPSRPIPGGLSKAGRVRWASESQILPFVYAYGMMILAEDSK